MIFGSVTSVMAVEFALIHKLDSSKNTNILEFMDDIDVYEQVTGDFSNYEIEYEGEKYSVVDVDAKLKDGAKDLAEAIEQLKGEAPEELKVVEVSAINSTTIKVKFSNGDVENFTVKELTEGENTVEFEYKGKKFTEVVNFTPAVKAAVENVDLVNYRQMKVTFNTVVDKDSAENPANYYFEIVEGKAGKLGAKAQLENNLNLKEIDEAWFDEKNINAETVNGKTVVTINFPYDARFGKAADDNIYLTSIATFGKAADDTDDNNNILTITLADGSEKKLAEDVKFNFAVRDVKDKNKKRTIDTYVQQLVVKDEVKPKLENAILERKLNEEDTPSREKIDLSKTIKIRENSQDKIKLVFDEPILAHVAGSAEIKVFVDGKEVKNIENKHLKTEQKEVYDDDRIIEVPLGNDGILGNSATVGDNFVVLITGLRDLAGNITQDKIKFNVEIVAKDVEPTPEKLEILGVEQVLDNVFRIEANQATDAGEVSLVIKGGDKDGKDVKVTIDNLKFEKYEFNKDGVDIKSVGKDGDKVVVEKKYYAYVAVPAVHDAAKVEEAGALEEALDFKGGKYLRRDVQVISEDEEPMFKTYTRENMLIEIDQEAPKIDKNKQTIAYEDASTTLSIGFTDRFPENWATKLNAGEIVKAQKAIFSNMATVDTDSEAVEKPIRIEVFYVNENGDEVSKYADIEYLKADGNLNDDALKVEDGALTIDLEKVDNGSLLVGEGTEKEIPSGAEYRIYLPKGVVSDDYAGEIEGLTVTVPNDAESKVEPKYIDTVGRTNKHGYTTVAEEVVIKIGEKESKVDEKKVPQTSKQLIGYDRNTNELVILVTGLPTRKSVEDLNNYVLNGKTLKELGASKPLFVDAQNADFEVVVSEQLESVEYKVIRIEVPKNSVEKSGPVDFTVRGLAHKDGAVMTEVTTVLDLEDNTAPKYVSGKIKGDGTIELKFDEPLDKVKDATDESIVNNFSAVVDGVETQVLSASIDENILTLEVANDLKDAKQVKINVKLNANGKMEITDIIGNELDVQTITVENN